MKFNSLLNRFFSLSSRIIYWCFFITTIFNAESAQLSSVSRSNLIPNQTITKEYPYTSPSENSSEYKRLRWPFRRGRRGETPPTRPSPSIGVSDRRSPAPTPPIPSPAPRPEPQSTDPSEYTELIPYILASPYQEDAGSCLFMSLTGIAEFFLARTNPQLSREENGPLDLSERHLMNLSESWKMNRGIANWKTDNIYLFNNLGYGILNRHFPFTKGYYISQNRVVLRSADVHDRNAQYGAQFNWINSLDEIDPQTPKVNLPKFSRKILFADPESNQWNIGSAPLDIAEKIKAALRENHAPVLVIYNHFGYWHANFIVGYDDKVTHNCPFVKDFFHQMQNKEPLPIHEPRTECSKQGVFFVRDSIYRDFNGPLYNYDPNRRGEEDYYSKKIITREYDWVVNLANHVVQIYAPNTL